jgi:hypothetical protein
MTLIKKTALVVVLASISAGALAEDKKMMAGDKKMMAGDKKMMAEPAPGGSMGMTMPKPSPEWEAFAKGAEGTWKCESVSPAGSMGPGSPEMKMSVTAKVKKDYGGFFLVGTYEMKMSKKMPAMKGMFTLGSPDGKTLVSTNMDSMGGSTWSSGPLGPDGGSTTGEGLMMGNKVKVRETTQKKSDKEIYHKVELDMGKGFATMYEDSCKK